MGPIETESSYRVLFNERTPTESIVRWHPAPVACVGVGLDAEEGGVASAKGAWFAQGVRTPRGAPGISCRKGHMYASHCICAVGQSQRNQAIFVWKQMRFACLGYVCFD